MATNSILMARILEIRAAKSRSINAFAEAIGIKQVTLDQQLNGKRKVSIETVMAVLNSFEDISPDWLLRGEGEMIKSQKPEHNVYDINYGNQVTGNGNITGNTAPVHYNTETEEDTYNELVTLRNKTRELQKKLDEANERNAALTDKLLKLI